MITSITSQESGHEALQSSPVGGHPVGAACNGNLVCRGPYRASRANDGPPTSLDAAARTSIVNAAADALTRRYVYPDVARRAAAAIKSALAAGSYDAITEPRAFADRLTADIAAIAHDKHLRVNAFGPPPAAGGAPPPAPPRAEAGVVRADRLPGNIGYIEISGFPPLQASKAPFDRAMAPLADTRALIIDIRRNGGGSPDSEVYLASYFLDPAKPVVVSRLIWRTPEPKPLIRRTSPTPPRRSTTPASPCTC